MEVGVGTEIGKTEEWGGRWKHGSAYTSASGRNWTSFSWLQKTILITSFPSIPLISSCNNGATNPTACNQCSNGYAYIGSSCVACSNGGCTGTGGNVSNPLGSLVCINGANNPTACSTFAPTATLSANPSTLDKGQFATLSWNSTNATSCTGTGFTAGDPSGTRSTGALNTSGTYNYQVVCTGAGGNSAPSFASVEVLAPSVTISANPARVQAGANSQISWSASSVSSCTVSGPSGTLASGPANSNRDFSAGSPHLVSVSFQSIFTITCATQRLPRDQLGYAVNVVPVFNEF